jgi:hypothetical protein
MYRYFFVSPSNKNDGHQAMNPPSLAPPPPATPLPRCLCISSVWCTTIPPPAVY